MSFPDFFFFFYLLVKSSWSLNYVVDADGKKIKQKPSFWLQDLK